MVSIKKLKQARGFWALLVLSILCINGLLFDNLFSFYSWNIFYYTSILLFVIAYGHMAFVLFFSVEAKSYKRQVYNAAQDQIKKYNKKIKKEFFFYACSFMFALVILLTLVYGYIFISMSWTIVYVTIINFRYLVNNKIDELLNE